MDRRRFLKGAAASIAASPTLTALSTQLANARAAAQLDPLESRSDFGQRPWVGKNFWANRLQDWERSGSEIVCRNGEPDRPFRTAHILTRRLEPDFSEVRIALECRNLVPGAAGLGGVLIGAGSRDLDYRSSALIHHASGVNGGIIACIDADGMPQFRAFDDPADNLEAALFAPEGVTHCLEETAELLGNKVRCEILIRRNASGGADLRLVVHDTVSGVERGCAVLPDLSVDRLIGNLALISSGAEQNGARFAFSEIATGGDVAVNPDRSLGPVMACMHTLDRSKLKLTAQLMPIDIAAMPALRFDWHDGAAWREGPTENVGEGYAVLFRLENWNCSRHARYRLVDPADHNQTLFEGEIRADPEQTRPLAVALHSCLLPVARQLDQLDFSPRIPQETRFERYSEDNLLFPHADMVARCEEQEPDIYVFCGDQYYETFPTGYGRDGPDALLDTLYRWYLFLWTWREPLCDRPAIVLADDHDILQGNIWGNAGEGSDLPREEDGGFKHDKALIRTIYRILCGHNPDPYDPTPIAYDIPVSYGSFVYGGTSFAFVEDRKFKDPPDYQANRLTKTGELLGPRQEAFLEAWAQMDPGLPKICLTASIWGSPQTAGNLQPLVDYDANGYPFDGRTRAVRLLRDAGAIALAGDQHLAMVAVQGIESPEDGPVFFAGPAGAAFWQRWFEGLGQLDGQRDNDPNTGNFVDCFGNQMRVLAVANPRIGYEEFMASKDYWGNFIADHRLKSEGFGIARVDHAAREHVFECWPRFRSQHGGGQYPGWPYSHPFPQL